MRAVRRHNTKVILLGSLAVFLIGFTACDIQNPLIGREEAKRKGQAIQFDGDNHTYATAVEATGDGGLVATGLSARNPNPDVDVLLFKANSQGKVQWHAMHSITANQDSRGEDIAVDSDGNLIVTGKAGADQSDVFKRPFLMKTDSKGSRVWTKIKGFDTNAISKTVIENEKGQYVIAGNINKENTEGVFISTYTKSGDHLQTNTFVDTADAMKVKDIAEAANGYMLTGSISGDLILLMKVTRNGEVVWRRSLGSKNYECKTETGKSILVESDGYVLGTHHAMVCEPEPPSWGELIKTDKQGNKVWSKDMGGSALNHAIRTKEGNYVSAGVNWVGPLDGINALYVARYVVGEDTVYSRSYRKSSKADVYGYDVAELKNGSIALVGEQVKFNTENQHNAIYLVVTDKPD